jgi:tRNA(Ile)-lysidine synthase
VEPQDLLILAVSGGCDSMCMLHIMQQLKYNLVVAHCNFKLRGDESDAEEEFVKRYCEKHHIKFVSKTFATREYCEKNKIGIQEGARILRYNWFNQLLLDWKAAFILTAHHANDNAETFLFNLARGAELNGMKSIPEHFDKFLRPLLKFPKQQLESYTADNQIEFKTDSSNLSDKYSRNFIRHQIIPKLETINTGAVAHINEAIATIVDLTKIAERYFSSLEKKYTSSVTNQTVINLKELAKEPQYELFLASFLLKFGFKKTILTEIIQAKHTGSYWRSPNYQLTLNRDELIVSEIKGPALPIILTTIEAGTFEINGIQFSFEITNTLPQGYDKNTFYIDLDKVSVPITIRSWNIGDSFAPLGMKGKSKKVSDFLIDKKISRPSKNQCIIIEDQEKICLVYPFIISDAVKLDPSKDSRILVVSAI